MKRPAFWILLAVVSIAATAIAVRLFPQAFSIVALDITMDRDRALSEARTIMARDGFGPPGFRQAASFTLDDETQTFVELEGGGKEAFTRLLRDGLYSAYTWRVRQFREGETNETLIQFTPDGQPYGFVEHLKEDAPGAALEPADARARAEAAATARWRINLGDFALIEQGQERRPGGRVDHTFTYERPTPTLNEGRFRLRLVLSGDRLTAVTHFVRIPEAFTRRYQNMRSANDAIGIGSVVGMALLYVVGGIGIGLFYMLRRRYVLWRQAMAWGAAVGLLQALATMNAWPLAWMTYDTALSRSTFIAQQLATIVATLLGFSAFFGLSFMAAETLTRRAFGSHPQFWRVWSKEPGSSTAILGRTAGGYLLVGIFFAYDVLLYLIATRMFGWWSPAEALLHPDVLATYVPWLSAIANSFQAGFWEECLFRAVPIAGAALIGDRFGQRRLFLVLGFIVQAIIFGAGHAPYPTLPSYARPVELILPSIGFGLLYVYFGLVPGIVLHFAFDVVWFALPIFLAEAPGIWFQQFMVVAITLVPLWVVLWRRMQVGHWRTLSPTERNAAWTPPPAPEAEPEMPATARYEISGRVVTAWLALGVLSALICGWALFTRPQTGVMPVSRQQAADAARRAVEARGAKLGPAWRLMAFPDDGSGGPHEFVHDTAGEDRRRSLLGTYLPKPRWRVRMATFEGDVAERAEEWLVVVRDTGEVGGIRHTLPEDRPGASLDESAARSLAHGALARSFRLDAARGDTREVSARPTKQKARMDWTFTFVDTTVPALPQGEPRVDVVIAGDEVTATPRYVFVPEEWERKSRSAEIRNLVLQILSSVVFGGLLVATAVTGVMAWSRRRYAPGLFFAAAATMLLVSFAKAANLWPTTEANLQTALPLPIQIGGVIGIGLVGLTIISSLIGLALGGVPHRLRGEGNLSDKTALMLGIAVGLFGAALAAIAALLRTPAWAHAPELEPIGSFVPFIAVVLDSVPGLMTRMAVVLSVLLTIDQLTLGWTRRRPLGLVALLAVGFLAAGAPIGAHLSGWLAAGLIMSVGLAGAYVMVVRADLTMVPISLGTMVVVGALALGLQPPFPGALPASVIAALVVAVVAWWWFGALRRRRARTMRGD